MAETPTKTWKDYPPFFHQTATRLYADELYRFARPPQPLVDRLIEGKTLIILAGAPKAAHKTFLALHLADCISQGKDFLGRKTIKTFTVYTALEDSKASIGYRMGLLRAASNRPPRPATMPKPDLGDVEVTKVDVEQTYAEVKNGENPDFVPKAPEEVEVKKDDDDGVDDEQIGALDPDDPDWRPSDDKEKEKKPEQSSPKPQTPKYASGKPLEDPWKRGRKHPAFGIDPDPKNHTGLLMTFGIGEVKVLMEQLRNAKGPVVWIIDTLVQIEDEFGVKSENNSVEMNKMLQKLSVLAHTKGHTIILIHHFRKEDQVMRGSSAVKTTPDGWVELFHDPNQRDHIAISPEMRNLWTERMGFEFVGGELKDEVDGETRVAIRLWDPPAELFTKAGQKEANGKGGRGKRKKNEDGSGEGAEEAEAGARDAKQKLIEQAIVLVFKEQGGDALSTRELNEFVRKAGLKFKNEKLIAACKQLVEDKVLQQTEKGSYEPVKGS